MDGLNALQPAFISSQVPSWHSLTVSFVTTGRGRTTFLGTSLPSSLATASFRASAPEYGGEAYEMRGAFIGLYVPFAPSTSVLGGSICTRPPLEPSPAQGLS